MANIKSAKKRAIQSEKRRMKNVTRRSAIKTATKAVIEAIDQGKDAAEIKALMLSVESKLARAKGKHVLHRNTAARKISRIAKKVAVATR